jgi:hypothetical protein
MGLIIYRATGRSIDPRHWQPMALYILAANAADLDFLPGLLIGDLARFHHGPSHSIGFVILFGFFVSAFSSRKSFVFVVSSVLYLSHLFLDYFVQDPSQPFGIPFLWPFSHGYYMAPFAFLSRFDYPPNLSESILSVFTFQNLATISTEILFFLPLLIFVSLFKRSQPG